MLAVVGHVNSNVSIAASTVYQSCGLPMVTPMSSNPAVTDRGLPNVFRLTNRDEVLAAMRDLRYQGIAYARPVAWDAKGDNTAAVIFLNVVEGDRFKEVGEITRADLPR